MNFPIENGGSFHNYVKLPAGSSWSTARKWPWCSCCFALFFYNISCVFRRAYGPFSPFCYLFFAILNHCGSGLKGGVLGGGFWGGRKNVLLRAFHLISDGLDATLLHFFWEHNTLLMLRCTLLHFFLEHNTLLMLRCYSSS